MQVLKEAITLEKEEQVEIPLVPALDTMVPVGEDRVEQCLTTLEEVIRGLTEFLPLGM